MGISAIAIQSTVRAPAHSQVALRGAVRTPEDIGAPVQLIPVANELRAQTYKIVFNL